MKSFLFLMAFSFLILSCASDTTEKLLDKCNDIKCSDHGDCAIDINNNTVCICNEGYHADVLECIEDKVIVNPCVDSECETWQICESTTGNCILKNNYCENQENCLNGYTCNILSHQCEMELECFENIDCSDTDKPNCENGICVADEIIVDKCLELNCQDWEICNLETETCDLRNNKCNTQEDCLNAYACDEINHECKVANECFINEDCSNAETPICKNSICVPLFPSEYCVEDYDCSANSIKTTCIQGECAVDDCSQDGYECAYNTNNRYYCNENDKCEAPIQLIDTVKDMVIHIMSKLTVTHYQNSAYVADVNNGELRLDCSYYVKQVIKRVSREHYDEIPHNNSYLSTALAEDYYSLFESIKADKYQSELWEVVPNITQAKAGDIIVYAYPDDHAGDTTGHVMIIMSTPVESTCDTGESQHWVWVSDSANSGHEKSTDTREGNNTYTENRNLTAFDYTAEDGSGGKPSGVGIGKMWFNTGSNSFYRWSSCIGTKHEVPILIGRMIKRAE